MVGDVGVELFVPLELLMQAFNREPSLPGLQPPTEFTSPRQPFDVLFFQLVSDGAEDQASGWLRFFVGPQAPHLLEVNRGFTPPVEFLAPEGITFDGKPLPQFIEQAVEQHVALLATGLR